MSETEAGKPSLKVIRGGKRKLEPPENFDLKRATSGKSRMLRAMDSDILARPVKRGTRKRPSFDEVASATELDQEVASKDILQGPPED